MPSADGSEGPWLVAGLGNPGPRYAGHRHSVGHRVLAELSGELEAPLRPHKLGRGDVAEARLHVGGPRVLLAVPRCYMNESGGPVAQLLDYYRVAADRLVVVHDELDVPFEQLRVKFGGGDNGHNGLRSIRRVLGHGDYYRVRVGVGRPPGRQDPADFLLSDYTTAERAVLPVQLGRAADAVRLLLTEGLTATQNVVHSW